MVAGILAEMLAAHELADDFVKRYEMKEPGSVVRSNGSPWSRNKVIATADRLREPRDQKNKFLWGVKDKEKFSEVVQRMESLNADLRELVRSNTAYSLAAALSSSLLPQLRETVYLVALQQSDTADPLLKLSARLKQLQQASDVKPPPATTYYELSRHFRGIDKASSVTTRPAGYFEKAGSLEKHAWIEWRVIPNSLKTDEKALLQSRIQSLAAMLATAQAPEFHIPPFEGLVEDTKHEQRGERRIGYVFSVPADQEMRKSGPKTLLSLFEHFQECPPLLNARFELAYKLASAVSLMHASKWLHKGLRSDNILFFEDKHHMYHIARPYVTGFDFSRPEEQVSLRDRPTGDPALDVYYHPDVAINGFNRVRDLYSLGVVLLEIGVWASMAGKISEDLKKPLDELTVSEYRIFFLDSIPILGSLMGASYRDAVEACLRGSFREADGEDGTALARLFFTQVLQKLSYCRA